MNISLAQKHADLAQHQAHQLAEILRDTTTEAPITGRTLPGDQRQLRGIPVVGAPGVGGAITGTRPGANLR